MDEWQALKDASGKGNVFVYSRGPEPLFAVAYRDWRDNPPLDQKRQWRLAHRYNQAIRLVTGWGFNDGCTYGELCDFAAAHADLEVWLNGEML